jgi:hypothetical protein
MGGAAGDVIAAGAPMRESCHGRPH